ncbi:MAG: YdcF family protein [Proteobacteria bacterium]|nr:YdcF family protein [Pseudomonadota bacterium]
MFYSIKLRIHRLTLITIAIAAFSMPITANWLWHHLEADYTPALPEHARTSEAIVVLSGIVDTIKTDQGFVLQWDSPGRFFAGIDLFKAGKAPIVVFTGGRLPWTVGPLNEGKQLKNKAVELGIPIDRVLVTQEVQNTQQEAKAVRLLLGNEVKTITLVTSAFHMNRASKLFERQGFELRPFAVNFKANTSSLTVLSFIPATDGLHDSFSALRESLGRIYYSIYSHLP